MSTWHNHLRRVVVPAAAGSSPVAHPSRIPCKAAQSEQSAALRTALRAPRVQIGVQFRFREGLERGLRRPTTTTTAARRRAELVQSFHRRLGRLVVHAHRAADRVDRERSDPDSHGRASRGSRASTCTTRGSQSPSSAGSYWRVGEITITVSLLHQARGDAVDLHRARAALAGGRASGAGTLRPCERLASWLRSVLSRRARGSAADQ
jgi:hypothetical protein